MQSIRQTEALNKRELEDCTAPEASWHRDYSDTAFVYVGGLDDRLTEGDVITIFSQYGEPVFLNMPRDKETGKSRGFAFLKYEDQRSCDLAVDNLGGAQVLGRLLRVDHTRYKKRDDEDMSDNTRGPGAQPIEAVNQDDDTEIEDNGEAPDSEDYDRPLLKEEVELKKLMEMDDEDPMKGTLILQKREELQLARTSQKSKSKHRSDKEHRRSHHSSHRKSKSRHHDKSERHSRRSSDH
jgi:RNA-binding motif X-linked protein 2